MSTSVVTTSGSRLSSDECRDLIPFRTNHVTWVRSIVKPSRLIAITYRYYFCVILHFLPVHRPFSVVIVLPQLAYTPMLRSSVLFQVILYR
jgi:hypothetical protein